MVQQGGKKSLPDGIRTDLELRLVPVLEFNDVPDKDLRSIFRLYNVSGTRLNPAEIRNAVYQTNLIHRVAYVLAGEASPPPDLGTGDLESQKSFTSDLWATLPSRKRYAVVGFIERYLGYSRATQRDPTEQFGLASTSVAINRYFDYASASEKPEDVAREVIGAFRTAEQFFNIDDERLAFYVRDENGKRRFNALVATSSMIAGRFLMDVVAAELATQAEAAAAAKDVTVPEPDKQQRATIWDYQARLLLGLRDKLSIDAARLAGDHWRIFFQKMQMARLPDEEIPA